MRPFHIHSSWYIDGVLSLPLHVCLLTTTQYLLPSLWLTAECGYDYRVVVGYDEGDPFYDTPAGVEAVQDWIEVSNMRLDFEPAYGTGDAPYVLHTYIHTSVPALSAMHPRERRALDGCSLC